MQLPSWIQIQTQQTKNFRRYPVESGAGTETGIIPATKQKEGFHLVLTTLDTGHRCTMHCTIPVKAHPNRNRNEKEKLKRKTKRRKDLTWH